MDGRDIKTIAWKDIPDFNVKYLESLRGQQGKSDNNRQNHVIVFTGVPLIPSAALDSFLRDLIQSQKIALKVSDTASFLHYSSDRYWSTHFLANRTYHFYDLKEYLDSSLCRSQYNVLEYLRTKKETECNHHLYASFPGLLPFVSTIQPAMTKLLPIIEQAQLWLNGPNTTAGWHYDSMDNILLQLQGKKIVYLLPPEKCSNLSTWPSFHPYYRQAIYNGSSRNVITIELKAGSMVYIPAGYWHSVFTPSRDSVSVNFWLHSSYTILQSRLRSVNLPFVGTKDVATRMARLGAMARQFCRLFDSEHSETSPLTDCLVESMIKRMRWRSEEDTDLGQCKHLCSKEDVELGEMNKDVKRCGKALFAVVQQYQRGHPVSRELILSAVVEFMEEAVLYAFTESAFEEEKNSDEDDYDGNGSFTETELSETSQDAAFLSPSLYGQLLNQCFVTRW
eukprot:gene11288-12592_t